MKLKLPLTTALLSLGLISHADAQTVVYVTGSTAFRGTVYNALITPGTVFDGTPAFVARGGNGGNGASYMQFRGNINSSDTFIKCAWSGSEAGVASVANVAIDNDGSPLPGSPETWLKADGSVTGAVSTSPTTGELEASSRQADLAFADTSQAVSLTPKVVGTSTDLKDYGTIGVVTFAWVKNVNSSPSADWTAMNNITWPQVNVMLAAGAAKAAYFTGNPAHSQHVYLVGRNKGSGTRANALADHGFGTANHVSQFAIGGLTGTPSTLTLTSVANDGYESGGNVAAALGINGSCQQTDPFFGGTGWFAIGYLGTGDAVKSGLTIANNWLTLNGVAESDGAIVEGAYSFWGYEHLLGKNGISGILDSVGSKIFNGVKSSLGTSGSVPTAHSGGIALQYMQCTKASDVAFPTRAD